MATANNGANNATGEFPGSMDATAEEEAAADPAPSNTLLLPQQQQQTAAAASNHNDEEQHDESNNNKRSLHQHNCILCSALTHEQKERKEGKMYQVLPASAESNNRGWMRCEKCSSYICWRCSASFPTAMEAAGLDPSDSKFLAACQDFVQQNDGDNANPRVKRVPVDSSSCCGFHYFLRNKKKTHRLSRKRKAAERDDDEQPTASQYGSAEKAADDKAAAAAALKSGPHYDGHIYFPDYNCLIAPSLHCPDVHGLQQTTTPATTNDDDPNSNVDTAGVPPPAPSSTRRNASCVSYSVIRPQDAQRWCVNGVTAKHQGGVKEIANDHTTLTIEHPIYKTPMEMKVRITLLPYVGNNRGDDGDGDGEHNIQQNQILMSENACVKERKQKKTHLWLVLGGT